MIASSVHRVLIALLLFVALALSPALAATFPYLDDLPPLADRVTPEVLAAVFSGAERIEILDDGGPPAAAVYVGEEVAGYVFSTLDVVRPRGYSGVPFDVIAGVDLEGRVTGAVALFHSEPHIEDEPRRQALLVTFLGDMSGMEGRIGATDGPEPKFIAGATISARAMRNAVRESASAVYRFRSGALVVTEPTLDTVTFLVASPEELLADGSLAQVVVTNADLQAALDEAGATGKQLEVPPTGGPDAVYLDLRVGLANPPTIGRNGAGANAYQSLFADFPPGSQGLIFGSSGTYNFQGNKFLNRGNGYRLERIRVLQGQHQFEFFKDNYILSTSALGTPRLGTHVGIGVLPPDSGFDPLQPFSVDVFVSVVGANTLLEPVHLVTLDYEVPEKYILLPEPPSPPAWLEAWIVDQVNIVVLIAGLAVLTLILALQSRLARSRRLHRWVRVGFLLFTLVWIGWIAGGQLSILHLLNYIQAPFQGLDFGFYLAEPLIVIVTIYTAISLVLLGRGVFCGWLCPFGALQELLAQISRVFRLPQWNPSDRLQKRLWWGKYASLATVVCLTFFLPSAGAVAAEVEPFKTAITSMFVRSLPYVIYAGAILAIGLFTERAFCRFLCPLGGALAILDRLHLLNLLKRRPECGSPCQLCSHSCPVRAIEPSGKIKMAECFQCLDCQVEYYDDHRCPPLAQQRKLRERASRRPRTVFGGALATPGATAP